MAFRRIPGIKGKIYVPDERPAKKHKCPDCKSCQGCSESRCKLCRKQKECAKRRCDASQRVTGQCKP